MSFDDAEGAGGAHRILVLDDELEECELLRELLASNGYRVTDCQQPARALELLSEGDFRVFLSDFHLGQAETNGIGIARRVNELHPGVFVILVTGDDSRDTALAALRANVFDFVEKDCDIGSFHRRLNRALYRALDPQQLASSTGQLAARVLERKRLLGEHHFETWLLGNSEAIVATRSAALRAAGESSPAVILGELGTEKRALATLIHERGPRSHLRLVHLDASSPDLAESKLRGLLLGREPELGTVHVAEADALTPALRAEAARAARQPRLPRLILSSLRPLPDCIPVAPHLALRLPPLRERAGDIPLLAEHFLDEERLRLGDPRLELSRQVLAALSAHSWPGNVDELRRCIRHAASLARASLIRLSALPPSVCAHLPRGASGVEVLSLEEMELQYIETVLTAVHGNKARAARLLGVDRTTLYRKLQTTR